MERWKEIPSYDGMYEISNLGRIRSWKLGGNSNSRADKPKILKKDSYGRYERCTLCKNNNKKRHSIHRLVAEAFVDNDEDKPTVNHIDGDRTNNKASNLEWVTQKENVRHSIDIGLRNDKGEDNIMSKLTECDVLDIRNTYRLGCFSQQEIANAYDVSQTLIKRVVNRMCWKHI